MPGFSSLDDRGFRVTGDPLAPLTSKMQFRGLDAGVAPKGPHYAVIDGQDHIVNYATERWVANRVERKLEPGRCWNLDGISEYVWGGLPAAATGFPISLFVRFIPLDVIGSDCMLSITNATDASFVNLRVSASDIQVRQSGADVTTLAAAVNGVCYDLYLRLLTATTFAWQLRAFDGVSFGEWSASDTKTVTSWPWPADMTRFVVGSRISGSASQTFEGQILLSSYADIDIGELSAGDAAPLFTRQQSTNAVTCLCEEGNNALLPIDVSGNKVTLTLVGTADQVFNEDSNPVESDQNEEGFSEATEYNGATDYLDTPVSISPTNSYEFGGFVSPAIGTTQYMFDGRHAASNGVSAYVASSRIQCHHDTARDFGHPDLDLNKWHQWRIKWDGATITLTLDGTDYTIAESAAPTAGSNFVRVGTRGQWNTPATWLNGGLTGLYGIVDGEYVFDYRDGGHSGIDKSGQNNHGTPAGNPAKIYLSRDLSRPGFDVAGQRLHYSGKASRAAAVWTPAATFSGGANYALTDASVVTTAQAAMTWGFWFKGTSASEGRAIFGQYDIANDRGFLAMLATGSKLEAFAAKTATAYASSISDTVIADSAWHRCVITFDGSRDIDEEIRIYVDGVESSVTINISLKVDEIRANTAKLSVGCFTNGGAPSSPMLDGSLSGAFLHEGNAWTPQQVWEDYNSGTIPSTPHQMPLCEGNPAAQPIAGGSPVSYIYKPDGTYDILEWSGTLDQIWASHGPVNVLKKGGNRATAYSGAELFRMPFGLGTVATLRLGCLFRCDYTAGNQWLLSAVDSSSSRLIIRLDTTGRISTYLNSETVKSSLGTYLDGRWHLLEFVDDGTRQVLMVDGEEEQQYDPRIPLNITANVYVSDGTLAVRAELREIVAEVAGTVNQQALYTDGNERDFSGNDNHGTPSGNLATFPIAAHSAAPSRTPAGAISHKQPLLIASQYADFAPEPNSPYAKQLIAAGLADTLYDVGDGNEANVQYARVMDLGDDRLGIYLPALDTQEEQDTAEDYVQWP